MKCYRIKGMVILALVILLSPDIHGQKLGLSASFGGGTFRMDDMKLLLEDMLASYPVEGKMISTFPPYYSGSFNLIKAIQMQVYAGAGYTYTSTGGKLNYTDYSGSLTTQLSAISHQFGAFIQTSVLNDGRFDLSVYGKLNANLTLLNISSIIYVLGYSNGRSYNYSSLSPGGSAGLEFSYFLKEISLGVYGGYMVEMPASLYDKKNRSPLSLPSDPQREVTAEWTGWRVGIKATVWVIH